MKNIKEFLNCLKETDIKVLNYDDFLNELKNTRELSTSDSLKTNMLTPKEGLISIDTFLDNLFTYKDKGHFLSNSEIKELENDKTNYTFTRELYTGNLKYSYLAHDINMDMFINNDGNYLVFLQVHGADARWGFSSYMALKFDTKKNYEDAFFYRNAIYRLISCLITTQEGITLDLDIASDSLLCPAYISVCDKDTEEEIVFGTHVKYMNLDNIKKAITDYLNSDKELSKKFHIKEFTDYDGTVELA